MKENVINFVWTKVEIIYLEVNTQIKLLHDLEKLLMQVIKEITVNMPAGDRSLWNLCDKGHHAVVWGCTHLYVPS